MTNSDCPICGDSFSEENSLQQHTWDAHNACQYCGDQFTELESMYTHWLTAHDSNLSRRNRRKAESAVGTPTFRDRLSQEGMGSALTGITVSRRALILGGLVGLGGIIGASFLGSSGVDETLSTHAAADGIENEPTLGPQPSMAEGTIIAFEDPSCPSCARFERFTYPQLKSELIDTERVSFVFRGIPVVYPWGEPAVHALEATYNRDPDVFWALKDFYYQEQESIGTENVLEVTHEFLSGQTEVDADAVIDDVESERFIDAVNADLQAMRSAGVRGTPTFFLFRGQGFVTRVVGPQSFDVFANSLGV